MILFTHLTVYVFIAIAFTVIQWKDVVAIVPNVSQRLAAGCAGKRQRLHR